MNKLIVIVLGLSLLGCSKEESTEVPVDTVLYKVEVITSWTSNSHPMDYPSNAHFSSIVGMSHNSSVHLYETGTMATIGIKDMAETGKTENLNAEIDQQISNGDASARLNGSAIQVGAGQSEATVFVNQSHPLVSVVSMIAPSPDWFIGAHDISLLDDGEFVDELTVTMGTYDAGTDAGVTFTSNNEVSDPQENIYVITGSPLGNGTGVTPPLAMVRFTKMD